MGLHRSIMGNVGFQRQNQKEIIHEQRRVVHKAMRQFDREERSAKRQMEKYAKRLKEKSQAGIQRCDIRDYWTQKQYVQKIHELRSALEASNEQLKQYVNDSRHEPLVESYVNVLSALMKMAPHERNIFSELDDTLNKYRADFEAENGKLEPIDVPKLGDDEIKQLVFQEIGLEM